MQQSKKTFEAVAINISLFQSIPKQTASYARVDVTQASGKHM
jgi:hypothetical protein